MSTEQLQKYDVVITTYQTITSEHNSSESGKVATKKKKLERKLFDVKWKVRRPYCPLDLYLHPLHKRIVLDEGHNIRNPKTKMAKAVCALDADRRWILTGTPIVRHSELLFILRMSRLTILVI